MSLTLSVFVLFQHHIVMAQSQMQLYVECGRRLNARVK